MAIDVCESLLASGTSAGHSISAVALIDAADGADGAQGLREIIVKLACQTGPLLLVSVDQPGGQCGSLTRCPIETCRERIEDLADALELDQAEVRQSA